MRRPGFGALDGAALVVTTVVGAGIFTVPAYVARLSGSGLVAIVLWIAGGLIAMAGALCYAELATRFRRGGAEYVYISEALGPTTGFLSGWTSFIAGFSGAIAAAAVGFGAQLQQVLPNTLMTSDGTPWIAAGLVVVFTAVVLAGMRAGKLATNALAVLVVVLIVVLVATGATGASGLNPVAAVTERPQLSALAALVPIFFTYSGWNAAAYVAGEFRDPARSLPRALVWGTLAVSALYVALNASLMRTVPLRELAGSAAPVADAARASLGGFGGGIVGALVLIALASSVCAMMITGPRIYREMSRDGALPAMFGGVNARGVPTAAVLAQSGWTIVLILTGSFEQIVAFTGFAIVVFSGLAVVSLFIIRARHGAPRGYSVPWYPVLPAAFVCVVAVMAVASFRYAPLPSMAGVVLILAGLPVRAVLMRGGDPLRSVAG
ncbi:MAG: amino acid permease [Gemmatimonadaceae bacterium]